MATLNLGHVVGPGVPTGGSTGQVLKKSSATNFATTWANVNDLTEISNIHNAIGIVVNGKQASVGASIGQYVILKNSTITGKTDGLYTAAKAITANTDIDGTYLTAVSNGGLNAINSNISTLTDKTTNKVSYTTAFDVSTASSGCHFYCDRIGRTIFIDIVINFTSAVAINTQIAHINGISNILETHVSAIGSNGTGARFLLQSSGILKIERALPENEWFSLSFVAMYNTGI